MKSHLIACFIFVAGATAANADELPRFERKIQPAPAKPPATTPENDDTECRDRWVREHAGEEMPVGYCEQNLEGDLMAPVIGIIFLSPFYVPALAVGDQYGRDFKFRSYPYDNNTGYASSKGKQWLFEAGGGYQWVSHDLKATRGFLSATTDTRLGLDLGYMRYDEHADDENHSLAFLDIVPTFAFARTERWDWRFGLGYQAIQGQNHHDRVKLTYKIRRYFQIPLHLDLDFGVSLASGKPIFELAPGIAYHWNRFALKAGYRRINISDVVLEGPELSLAIWF